MSPTPVSALVDVQLILEKLTANLTRAGEWVNVLGYVSPMAVDGAKGKRAAAQRATQVRVQALLLWSAGSLNVRDYESFFDEPNGGDEAARITQAQGP